MSTVVPPAGSFSGAGGGESGAPARDRSDPAWDVLLIAVAAYMLASVARIHLLFPFLETIRFTMIAGGGALVLYALNHHSARRIATLGSPVTVLLVVFTGWMAFTVPWGLRQYNGFVFLTDNFLKTVALFVLIVGCVRGVRDVDRLAFFYFAGAAAYAAVVMVRFSAGESWRLGDLVTYDSNDFAVFAVSAVPLGVYFLGDAGRSLKSKLTVAVGLAVLCVAFVQSGSRGGFLAMGAVAVFLLVRHRAVPLRWRIAGIGLLGVVLAVFASARFWDQMGTMLNPGQDYNLTSETGRLAIWSRAVGYLADSPILGVGPANFPVAEGVLSPLAFRQDYGIGVRWSAPHNSFIQVAVELGVPGLLLFLALLGSVFVLLRRMERSGDGAEGRGHRPDRPGDRPALAQALMGSLVGFLVGAFFLSLAYTTMLFTLIALAAALWKTCGVGSDRLVRRPTRRRGSDREPSGGSSSDREDAAFILR